MGGGAARGLAHIGVLEVLQKEGIPIDMIAGTSIGAAVGAVYARNKDSSQLRKWIIAQSRRRLASFVDLALPKTGFIKGDKIKEMFLEVGEFIRRFLLHVLPDQFFKIRYYGILSARNRKTKLKKCKELLGVPVTETDEQRLSWQELLEQVTGTDPTRCPHCKKGRLFLVEVLDPIRQRSPP